MKPLFPCLMAAALGLGGSPLACAQAPTVETLKQLLQQRLQKLRPEGASERNVLFQDVRAAAPNGGDYLFLVTALIRDYEAGYPANRYYGQTCVGRMDQRKFIVSLDEFRQWKVEGAMTVTSGPDKTCKPNPAAGVSSIPLQSLAGSAAPAGAPAAPTAAQGTAAGISTGEWACYGSGGRLLIGLGFRITADGKYTDLDRKGTGTYSIQGSTIRFRGGHLDGQSSGNFRGNRFDMGNVSCEVFH